ncbi:MAG: pyridoxamine 5'-phosphate oxidase family protein [Chloroflexota bacterium]|nr:pyridoxamine 5'-phosphate oxidase family protein [Chloroflexota bacterium]
MTNRPAEPGGELPERECLRLLASQGFGRLGCYSPTRDESYVVPISYVYHPGAIYFATVPGQKLDFLREHPRGACLEVETAERQDQLTVIVTGDFQQLESQPAEAAHPQRGLLRPAFDDGLTPYPAESLVLCKLNIRKVSGRRDRRNWRTEMKLPQQAQRSRS